MIITTLQRRSAKDKQILNIQSSFPQVENEGKEKPQNEFFAPNESSESGIRVL